MGGPPPKRDAERRRRNKPDVPTESVDIAEAISDEVVIPKPDPLWHPVAKLMLESIAKSGQALFYEPSDWAVAYLMCESLSRDLEEQVVGITDSGGKVYAEIPMKGASLSAYLKAMGALLMTEGDRRRARIEIERANAAAKANGGETPAGVTSISEHRESRFRRQS